MKVVLIFNEFIAIFTFFFPDFITEHIIPMPSFMFGGKVGSRVSSIVFKKK